MPLRVHADGGVPLVVEDPEDPASQAIRQAARGLIGLGADAAADAAAAGGLPPSAPAPQHRRDQSPRACRSDGLSGPLRQRPSSCREG